MKPTLLMTLIALASAQAQLFNDGLIVVPSLSPWQGAYYLAGYDATAQRGHFWLGPQSILGDAPYGTLVAGGIVYSRLAGNPGDDVTINGDPTLVAFSGQAGGMSQGVLFHLQASLTDALPGNAAPDPVYRSLAFTLEPSAQGLRLMTVIPEPSTASLLLVGLGTWLLFRRSP